MNIMIVGVGGQGSLLASRLLGRVLTEAERDVKVSEVHGMSQRGGSVVTYVKSGDRVASPLIDPGEADYIVSFEKLEAARYAPYLKVGGRIITGSQQIDPMPVITGAAAYPADVLHQLRARGVQIDEMDALTLAESSGSSKAVNIVLMGRLARYLGIAPEKWIEALKDTVAPKFFEMNCRAFDLGYNA